MSSFSPHCCCGSLPSLSLSLGPPASSEVPFQGESWTPKSVSSDHCALQCSAERDTPPAPVVWMVHSRRGGGLDLAAAGASERVAHGGRRGRNPEGSWSAASPFCPRGQFRPKWRRRPRGGHQMQRGRDFNVSCISLSKQFSPSTELQHG